MTVLASDNFNRADGAIGTGWTSPIKAGDNALVIVSNAVRTALAGGNDATAAYTGITWPNDQYSKCKFTAFSANRSPMPICRDHTSGSSARYGLYYDAGGGDLVLFKFASGYTELSRDHVTVTAGDTVELRCVGTTISSRLNGTQIASVTDSSHSSGNAGIEMAETVGAGSASEGILDDWEGGSISTSSTLTAAAGAYALTGTAAALRKASKVAAAAGSYAQTGTAATLTYTPAGGPTHTLAANFGTLGYTGAAAALIHRYTLSAAAGAYALTGTAAALRKASKMAAAAASFAITGTAAGLRFGHALVAAAGSYAQSGTVAALRKASKLIAAAASFVISGTAAALSHGGAGAHTLTADAGTFTLTGAAAVLKKASKMAGAAASFVITGAAAGLSKAQVMAAAAGAYVLTGTAAAFATTRALVASAALYLLTGAAATLSFFQSNAFYLSPWLQAAAAAIMRALGNTDVTIDYGGGGAVAGVRAHRRSRGFDPAIGDRSFMSDATEFLVEQITAPASLVPGVTLLDETNLQQFKVHRVIPNRGGLLTIYVKNP